MAASNKPLLTIAVPTYNRASYLRRSLTSVLSQTAGYGDCIEVIVSDNCSTDETVAVVQEFISAGHALTLSSNPTNIGPDGNFRNCFNAARGTYFLLFSDDDVLLDGTLDKVMTLLRQGDFGVVHLGAYFFNKDLVAERPRRPQGKQVIYSDVEKFASAVNIWFTFISCNVINRELLGDTVQLDAFANTNLLQLGWTLPAMFEAKQNAHLTDYLVAAQFDNSGGYKFCEVFGVNINRVFTILSEKYGYDSKVFESINRITLKRHLSKYILAARKDFGTFHQEDFLQILHPVFQSYASYWVFIYPAVKWPLPLAKLWCKICRRFAKMAGTL